METRISSKGQITLPVAIRKKLKIKAGDMLKLKLTEEGTVIIAGSAIKNNNQAKTTEVLNKTTGIWKDMEETGEEFVHRLRKEDSERWKVLGLD